MSNNSKKGFTLVELSIVLVIIGLLIGGILVAQSMISTAKVQATTRQLGQFDAAVANFYTKFNQLPGDNNVMGTTTGNNDGFISDSNSGTTVAKFAGEIGKFWYDLSIGGLKTTGSAATYLDASANSGSQTQSALVNTYIPSAPIGTNIGVMAFGASSGSNFYELNAFTTSAGTITAIPGSALKAADALAIDSKIDDGSATGGSVYGTVATSLSTAGTAYAITNTNPTTGLVVRIGLQSGNLQ